VDLLLPDILMIALAVVMIPVVLIPLLVNLPPSVRSAFTFADYAVLSVFIIEYIAKAALAPNILRHVLNPWHLLDLLVIAVPLISLVPAVSIRYGSTSLILRLFRIIRVVAVGSRAVDRRLQLVSELDAAEEKVTGPIEIQVAEGSLDSIRKGVSLEDLHKYMVYPPQTWANVSSVSNAELDQLSGVLNVPRMVLESQLTDEAYPRVEYFDHYSLIYARIGNVRLTREAALGFTVERKGVLIICQGENIVTISKAKIEAFDEIAGKARRVYSPGETFVVTVLYAILKHILDKNKEIIGVLERELMEMESVPLGKQPRSFLETTFRLRKEANQIVPGLLHLKEVIAVINSKRVPLSGFAEKHEKIFNILLDEADYLYETASNARDDLQSLIDLYINTTSYETNRVMRVIAVITSLGILPALIGLLGSNIAGNPWNIQLWQVFGLLAVLMLVMGWIFYRLGWLRG
jgi:Mg2+ and Co2+ transporter CorA